MADKSTNKTTESEETNRQKFVRLLNARGGEAVKRIRLLAPLGNKAQYESTDADFDALEKVLSEAVKDTMAALRSGKTAAAAASIVSE